MHKEIFYDGIKFFDFYYIKSDLEDSYFFHNENGPAVIEYDLNNRIICEKYYINNAIHNSISSAINEYYYSSDNIEPSIINRSYFFNGEKIKANSDGEYIKILNLRNIK